VYAATFDFLAEIFAWPLTQFYALTGSYALSIMLITLVGVATTTPLTLKSTKGMLEMQRLQPELRKLQQQHRGDRQMLNQEMMKLYQEHKVNPLASCLPLLLQMPVFFGMFTLLRGLTQNTDPDGTFAPRIIDPNSQLYKDLDRSTEMLSWGLDLARSPAQMLNDNFARGVLYVFFVVLLGLLYWVQQRMIANRSVSPTMSPVQAKIMQYLPVAFAIFQVFFPLGLVLYYMWQTVLRIVQQEYITRRFYKGEQSLGRQAHEAGKEARELAKNDKTAKANGVSGRPAAKGAGAKSVPAKGSASKPGAAKAGSPKATTPSKGATAPKGKPTPSGRPPKPSSPTATPAPTSVARPTKPVKPQKPTKPQKPQQ
jgi:YidC/Oxa1 family membrane protein insertase